MSDLASTTVVRMLAGSLRIGRSIGRAFVFFAATILLVTVAMPVGDATDASPLVPFLLKAGEMSGFTPGRPQVFRTVVALEKASEDNPRQVQLRSRRYEAEGFAEGVTVRMHDKAEPSAKGISSVSEFETPTGAKAEMKAELKEELDSEALRKEGILRYFLLRHFRIPRVPRAVAFAFVSNKVAERLGLESGIAKGLFVEGSCLLAVGDFSLTSKEVTEPVINGVQAIGKRTGGNCP